MAGGGTESMRNTAGRQAAFTAPLLLGMPLTHHMCIPQFPHLALNECCLPIEMTLAQMKCPQSGQSSM